MKSRTLLMAKQTLKGYNILPRNEKVQAKE
jgi:hypothetical protein